MKDGQAPVSDHVPEEELRCGLGKLAADINLDTHTRQLIAGALAAWQDTAKARDDAERRYRTLFDAVPDPVSIIDWDGTVLDMNSAGLRLFGRERGGLVGEPIETINPDLPRDHMVPVLDALGRGESYVIEVTNMRADGTRFPVEVHSAAIEYDGVQRIVAVARDLSSRADVERRYAELIESVDNGIVVQDGEGRVVHINSAAMRILGLKPGDSSEAALSSDRWLVVDENGLPILRSQLPARIARTTGKMVESQILGVFHTDTDLFCWLSVTVIPKFHPQSGKPDQTLSLFSDITVLKRDSAMFQRVQSLATIGAWEYNHGNAHVYLTDGARGMLGKSGNLDSLEMFCDCFTGTDALRLAAAIDKTYNDGGGFSLDLRTVEHGGVECWVRVQGKLDRKDPSGQSLTGTVSDISERKMVEDTLRKQARTDPLTGLLNRDAILDELQAYLAGASPNLAVLYIDLDRFKIINDVLGHNVGDRLLCAVAERLWAAVGNRGLCARLGGDEFLVLCRLTKPSVHIEIAEAILAEIARPFRVEQEEFSISASIGITESPRDGCDALALIQNADAAMYDSKRRAYNGWQSYTDDLARRQRDRLQVDFQMRSALDNNELTLLYQPQVDLRSGMVVGAEALMRWHNSQLGVMRPDIFISHAESTGEIIRLGAWALREACMQVRRWRDQGHHSVRVAVNVSYRQFLADDLAGTVEAALAAAGIPGTSLELEFTERVLIEDEPDTLRTFAQLRELGVMLSIDDFGEGYSGLNYLRRLPIHGLKLSQLFLQGVPGNTSDVAVCQAVSGIARSLGLGLVAEGVENEAQRRFLVELGVPVGQGYLFAPALKPDDFIQLLTSPPYAKHGT